MVIGSMINLKVLKEFYLYYFAYLTTYDLVNNDETNILFSLERFHIMNSQHYHLILKYTYVDDSKFNSTMKKLIKEVNQRLKRQNVSVVRNTLYTDFPQEIDYVLDQYKQVFSIPVTSLSDLSIFLKSINRFLEIFDVYLKNILALSEVNEITDAVLKNLNDNTIKNVTKIAEKYNKSVRQYLTKMDEINISKIVLNDSNVYKISNDTYTFNRIVIPTGFNLIDEAIGGGLQSGRIYLIGGKTGLGKSSFLIQLAVNFLKQNKKILLITLENSVEETIERIYANISDIPMNKLLEYSDDVNSRVSEFFNTYKDAQIEVVFYPADTLTVEQISERVRLSNVKYDIIMVDYLDLLKYQSSQKIEERIRLTKIVRLLKKLAQETNTVVISPSQLQRGVYRSKIVEVDNISESFGKITESDGVFIVEATPSELAENNTLRINIGKMRHGKSGVRIEMSVDFSKMKFVEIRYVSQDEIENEEDEDERPRKRKSSKKPSQTQKPIKDVVLEELDDETIDF